jgi:hypothetical protein
MTLGPMIVVGCGGSGGAVVTALRTKLENSLLRSGWTEGIPSAWQLIWADTPTVPDDMSKFGKQIPQDDYVSISQGLPTVKLVHGAVSKFLGAKRLPEIAGWEPDPNLSIPINLGAGQWRAVGRLAAIMSLSRLGSRVDHAMNEITLGKGQLDRLVKHLGFEGSAQPDPLVVVVSSLAGGTGSGVFLDACDVITAKRPELTQSVVGILFTAEVFDHLNLPGLEFNTVAALSELCAGYFTPPQDLPKIFAGAFTTPAVTTAKRGPTYPFIIGKKTFDGNSLNSTDDVYRSVTETLSSLFMNVQVYDEFAGKLLANWPSEQLLHDINDGRGAFLNKVGGTDDVENNGVVSSFGSARLCVGSAMFSEYAAHRMARDVVEFMHSGFLAMGKKSMGDQQASASEVLRWFRERHAIAFVRACGMEEVNTTGVNNDQILERLIPDVELRNVRIEEFIQKLSTEVAAGVVKEIEAPQLESHVKSILSTLEPKFLDEVNIEIDRKTRQFVEEVPAQIIKETSTYMAAYGVPVAIEMVQYLDEHLEAASRELQSEIQKYESAVSQWESNVASVFSKLRSKDKVDGRSIYAKDASRQAASRGFGISLIAVRKRAIELIDDLRRQVLKPVLLKLDQVSESLSAKGVSTVSGWPLDGGVPDRFAPSPLDFCLVGADEWPRLYDQLLEDTVRRENSNLNDSTDYVRQVVGSGGFVAEAFGSSQTVPSALTLKNSWTRTGPIQFETNISVDDVLSRAQIWVNRVGTPLGDFSNVKLGAYLSDQDSAGNPEPQHDSRMARFNDSLDGALRFAQPLVYVDQSTFNSVIGKPGALSLGTRLIKEPMPFSTNTAARQRAEEILKSVPGIVNSPSELGDFFFEGADVESVLFVSRIKGAVHPMLFSSVTAPIHQRWSTASQDGAISTGVWEYRRARQLHDFIPVRPRVRKSLIRGWIVGRLLGLISAPQEDPSVKESTIGPKIIYKGREAQFLWPPTYRGDLNALVRAPRQHLPAILESMSVAMLLSGQSADVMGAYEALYILGEKYESIIQKYIQTGSSEGEIAGAAILKTAIGADLQSVGDRRDGLRTKLEANRKQYEEKTGDSTSYGFELYEEIISQIVQLEIAVQTPDDEVGDF